MLDYMDNQSTPLEEEIPLILASAIIIVNSDAVLLLKRHDKASWMPGKWCLPCGIVENNEQPKETAIRETEEETSIVCKKILTEYVTIKYNLIDKFKVFFYFTEFQNKPDVKLNNENSDYKWVEFKDLPNYDIVREVESVLKFFEYLNSPVEEEI